MISNIAELRKFISDCRDADGVQVFPEWNDEGSIRLLIYVTTETGDRQIKSSLVNQLPISDPKTGCWIQVKDEVK